MLVLNNQPKLLTFENELGEKQRKALEVSKEKWFYTLIFRNIREEDFKPLYSNKPSRPNVPVNILVAALILKELKGLSYDELMKEVMFNMLYKAALGLSRIDETPFSRATLFNFQTRVLEYQDETGINLIEKVFDNLTADQLKKLSIKTDIQRTDSTLVNSNIKRLSRVQLIIEVLLRLARILDEEDEHQFAEDLLPYLKKGSEKYVFGLKSSDLPHTLTALGSLYQRVYTTIVETDKYQNTKEFNNFERIFREHFTVIEREVEVKSTKELHSGMLQSPDDSDATYREKRGQHYKGFTINGTETANPDNPVQLVTDICTSPNNVDDSSILEGRIEKIKEKTPEFKESHTDGGYGSKETDRKCEENDVQHITTAVRGRESGVSIKIEQINQIPESYTVECPIQKVESMPTPKRHKANFNRKQCEQCPLKENCRIFKNKGRYYFTHEDYLQNKRSRRIMEIPPERRKLRPNVESLMKEFKYRTNGGKLKVRGLFKASLFAFNVGIAVNFGRIYRYLAQNASGGGINGPDGGKTTPDGFVYGGKTSIFYIILKILLVIVPWIDLHPTRLKVFSNTPSTSSLNFGSC